MNSYSLKEMFDAVEVLGVGAALEEYRDYVVIEDEVLSRLWLNAHTSMNAIEQYLNGICWSEFDEDYG